MVPLNPGTAGEWSDDMTEELKDLIEACNQLIENYKEGDEGGDPYFVNADRGWDALLCALDRIEGGAK